MSVIPFRPQLTRIHSFDLLNFIPDFLGDLSQPLDQLFSKVRIKNFISAQSGSGHLKYRKFQIVFSEECKLEIPGTGMFLALNPASDQGISPTVMVDATFIQRWGILELVPAFTSDQYAGTVKDFLSTLAELFGVNDEELLQSVIESFIVPQFDPAITDILTDPYDCFQQLLDRINSEFNLTGQDALQLANITNPANPDFSDLLQLIKTLETLPTPKKIFDVFCIFLKDLQGNDSFENLWKILKKSIKGFDLDKFLKLIIPEYYLSINGITVALELPRNVLQPYDLITHEIIPEPAKSKVILNSPCSFSISTANGFDFVLPDTLSFTFTPSVILNSGLVISFDNIKFDFSKTLNIPEAIADGRPDDFVGAFVETAEIDLPQKWFKKQSNNTTLAIRGKNLLLGTGGISGTIGLFASDNNPSNGTDELKFNFGKNVNDTPNAADVFAIGFNNFDITFQQNAFVNSNLKGKFYIPQNIITTDTGTQVIIDIDVSFDADGDFHITAKAQEGIVFHIPKQDPGNPNNKDILSLTLKSLSVGKTEDRFYIEIAGKIDFNVVIPALGDCLPKGIDVEKLRIWEDGSMEFVGGVNLMPIPKEVTIGPVKLSISSLSMGTHEQMYEGDMAQYRYFGFDGGVNVNPGGVDARVNGVKFYYNIDPPHDVFVRIEGIAIDLVLPGNCSKENAAVILSGFLSMKDPDPNANDSTADTEYGGGVSISLPKLQIAGSAAMRLNPNKPAFIVDMGLELNTPIPLGSTGLGIYGFRGLVGEKYVADKGEAGVAEDASWYEYYKIPPEGICIDKFEQRNGFALGAGVSLATSSDSGKVFSSKLFFLLSLPDVFLLQGQAAILSKRIGLDTVEDPPFSAMIAITSQSVEAGFGINYRLPEEGDKLGKIVRVDGLIEMGFFFGDSSAWYVNIGRDAPPEKRIQARILDLFNAYFYLMLSSGGIKAGAGASFDFNKKFGPVEVFLGAYIDLAGHISFQPKQIGGSIDMGGYAGIKIFKFKLGFSIAASLAAEAPKPHVITGSVTLTINLPWPFDDINLKINFTWTFSNDLHTDAIPFISSTSETNIPFAKALNIQTKESFEVYCNASISSTMPDSSVLDSTEPIPFDSYIDIELVKGVWPDFDNSVSVKRFGDKHGANYIEKFAPDKAASEQVRHEYWVTGINIYSNITSNVWEPYEVYEAATPMAVLLNYSATDWTNLIQDLKYGYWQLEPNKYTKLRVLATNPLTFLNQGTGGYAIENMGIDGGTIFCAQEVISETCVNFEGLDYNLIHEDTLRFLKNLVYIKILNNDGEIITIPEHFGVTKALQLMPDEEFEILFTESTSIVHVGISTKVPYILVSFLKKVQTGVDINNSPIYDYELAVPEKTYYLNQLSNPIEYSDLSNPIQKIIIKTASCDEQGPLVCETAITDEATCLEGFLNSLTTNNNLTTAQFNLNTNPVYQTTFSGTILYDCSLPNTLQYQSINTLTVLTAVITDGNGFILDIGFEIINPNVSFSYSNIESFSNLRPDPDHISSGANRYFLIDAHVSGIQQAFVLKGHTSKYPIVKCKYINHLLKEDAEHILQEESSFILLDKGDALSAECSTLIYGMCWLTVDQELFINTIPSQSGVQEDNNAMLNGLNNVIQPIWRPNTKYLIRITAEDRVFKDEVPHTIHPSIFDIGFKTRGTLGFFHKDRTEYSDLIDKDRTDEYKLASLKHYIDYSKSYPNADGNILNAKPLFYNNPTLLMFYLQAYVPMMFMKWDAYNGTDNDVDIKLKSVIKDTAPEPNQLPIAVEAEWVRNDHPKTSEDIAVLNNLILNYIPCTNVAYPITPIGTNAVFALPSLKPLKLYTAIFNAEISYSGSTAESSEVHRYAFQTSRYGSFAEQVNSYILSNIPGQEKYAIFNIVKAINIADLQKAQAIISETMDLTAEFELVREFQDIYDRLVYGVLKMEEMPPAVSTEFNILKDNINSIIKRGILIRNPEPFNDPKLPKEKLLESITVSQHGAQLPFKTIFSKDKTKIFITNDIMEINATPVKITFTYFEYNGQEFVPKTIVAVIIDLN